MRICSRRIQEETDAVFFDTEKNEALASIHNIYKGKEFFGEIALKNFQASHDLAT